MNIAVTGASGFIGRNLVEFLTHQGHKVYSLIRPTSQVPAYGEPIPLLLESRESLQIFFNSSSIDIVFHLASLAKPDRDLMRFQDHIKSTILPSINIACTVPNSVKMVFFFGSCEEYGNGVPPFVEAQPSQCFSPYGWAKTASLEAVKFIMKERTIPFCWLRPFLIFGPDQVSGSVIPFTIQKCLNNENVPLTRGEQTRDFLFIEDLCSMLNMILQNPTKAQNQILNLCSGQPRSIKSVVEEIHHLVGSGNLELGKIPYRSNEAMSFYGSPEKFNSLYGQPQLTDIQVALEKTVKEFQAQYLRTLKAG